MYEKLNTLRLTCNIAGSVALLIYIMLCFGGSNSGFLVIRVITAVIALTAYSIKCGAEIMSDEKLGNTIFLMAICLFDIIFSAIMLV
ncbi:MAG: hypothetical protein HFJ50_09165 [Clostridia bacterium]|jgi:hypothetical protein|nr:hypothetical protein [Clostridia bacterium]